MNSKIIKLGVRVVDTVSKSSGILTMLQIDMDGAKQYCFQPYGLNKTTKKPLEQFWVTAVRLEKAEHESRDLPVSVLGQEVKDTVTGFKGVAIFLYLHSSGCVHFDVKPRGTASTGESHECQNFNVHRLEGKAIVRLSEDEKRAAQQREPSPGFAPSNRPLNPNRR